MGTWVLTIKGTGCHHNGKAEIDVDLLAPKLVKQLQNIGQNVKSATLTLTSDDADVMPKADENKLADSPPSAG